MLKRWKIKRIIKKLKAMQANRVNNQPGDELLKKEIAYCHEAGELYKSMDGSKKFPYASLMYEECLRAAASLEDAQANYKLGKELLERAKFRENLEQEGVFKSEVNEVEMRRLYEQAHAYLLAAMNFGSIEGKRLRGLCYINGWGIEVNQKAGFELVVDSIEQEGAWDRVPQIFASIGLNKPEFFSAITQRRKSL